MREGMRGLAETETVTEAEAEAVLGLSESVSVLRVLLVATAVLVSVLLVRRRQKLKQRRRAARHVQDPRYCTFPLMQIECMGLTRAFAVTTLTFYQGNCADAESWLRKRTLEVMYANPWLAGRLLSPDASKPSESTIRVCFKKSFSESDLDSYFYVTNNPTLTSSMKYKDILQSYSHLSIKRGVDCLDNDNHLFRVIFIRISTNSFALILSMSHLLGDGCTYYRLYSMLSHKEDVVAMTVSRQAEKLKESMCMIRTVGLARNPIFLATSILYSSLPKFSRRTFIVEVDTEWVAEQKKQCCLSKCDMGAPFVSTNDILVSWFNNAQCLDYSFMAVNARGRSPYMKVSKYYCILNVISLL